jgi:hypothetical protein
LTLLCNGRDFSGFGPAHLGLDRDCVPCGGIISITFTWSQQAKC